MQSVDMSALEELDRRFEQALKDLPGARREMHERIAQAVKGEVQSAISTSGMKHSGGDVPGWQEDHVGSGGGYAAVRPEKGVGPSGKAADGPGAITNYLEGGHKIRPPTGRAKRPQRGRAKTLHVKGYHFYATTSTRAEAIALAEADKFAQEIAGKIGD